MLHPDYQYDPRLITAMAAMVASGIYDVVLGSRILGNTARRGGIPLYFLSGSPTLRIAKTYYSQAAEDAPSTKRL
jgi:hypothetical protein